MDSNTLGKLVLTLEGDILQSTGSLKNNEYAGHVIMTCINILRDYRPANGEKNFHRISFVYSDRAYIVSRSNQLIQVVQKRVTEAPRFDDL